MKSIFHAETRTNDDGVNKTRFIQGVLISP